jgi:hypothetical protein
LVDYQTDPLSLGLAHWVAFRIVKIIFIHWSDTVFKWHHAGVNDVWANHQMTEKSSSFNILRTRNRNSKSEQNDTCNDRNRIAFGAHSFAIHLHLSHSCPLAIGSSGNACNDGAASNRIASSSNQVSALLASLNLQTYIGCLRGMVRSLTPPSLSASKPISVSSWLVSKSFCAKLTRVRVQAGSQQNTCSCAGYESCPSSWVDCHV